MIRNETYNKRPVDHKLLEQAPGPPPKYGLHIPDTPCMPYMPTLTPLAPPQLIGSPMAVPWGVSGYDYMMCKTTINRPASPRWRVTLLVDEWTPCFRGQCTIILISVSACVSSSCFKTSATSWLLLHTKQSLTGSLTGHSIFQKGAMGIYRLIH